MKPTETTSQERQQDPPYHPDRMINRTVSTLGNNNSFSSSLSSSSCSLPSTSKLTPRTPSSRHFPATLELALSSSKDTMKNSARAKIKDRNKFKKNGTFCVPKEIIKDITFVSSKYERSSSCIARRVTEPSFFGPLGSPDADERAPLSRWHSSSFPERGENRPTRRLSRDSDSILALSISNDTPLLIRNALLTMSIHHSTDDDACTISSVEDDSGEEGEISLATSGADSHSLPLYETGSDDDESLQELPTLPQRKSEPLLSTGSLRWEASSSSNLDHSSLEGSMRLLQSTRSFRDSPCSNETMTIDAQWASGVSRKASMSSITMPLYPPPARQCNEEIVEIATKESSVSTVRTKPTTSSGNTSFSSRRDRQRRRGGRRGKDELAREDSLRVVVVSASENPTVTPPSLPRRKVSADIQERLHSSLPHLPSPLTPALQQRFRRASLDSKQSFLTNTITKTPRTSPALSGSSNKRGLPKGLQLSLLENNKTLMPSVVGKESQPH